MSFINPDSAGRPATGQVASALWGDDVDDDLNALAAPPCVRAFTTSFAIPNSAETAINLTGERWKNRAAMHSNTVNPSRVTPDLPGLYLAIGSAWWGGEPNIHGLAISFNGAVWPSQPSSATGGDAGEAFTGALTLSNVLLFNGTTDYLQLHAYQFSGASLNIAAELTVIKLSIETS